MHFAFTNTPLTNIDLTMGEGAQLCRETKLTVHVGLCHKKKVQTNFGSYIVPHPRDKQCITIKRTRTSPHSKYDTAINLNQCIVQEYNLKEKYNINNKLKCTSNTLALDS